MIEDKCEFCGKMGDWAEGKIQIELKNNLCQKCVQIMLIVQMNNLALHIKSLVDFYKHIEKKQENWISKIFHWLDKEEKDINKGEEWKG